MEIGLEAAPKMSKAQLFALSNVACTATTTAGDAPSPAVSAPASAARLLLENAARLRHACKTEMGSGQ